MADDWEEDATRRAKAALISTTVPNAARVADYLYGGHNNFEADRRAARALAATAPVIATIARETLDFSQPVAVMLLFTLAYVQDAEEAAAVVSSLMTAAPSGSYVAIYHLAIDVDPELEEAAILWNKMLPEQPITLRSRSEVAGLTVGLDPVPPGLVPVTEWRPDPADPRFEDAVPVHGIVARTP